MQYGMFQPNCLSSNMLENKISVLSWTYTTCFLFKIVWSWNYLTRTTSPAATFIFQYLFVFMSSTENSFALWILQNDVQCGHKHQKTLLESFCRLRELIIIFTPISFNLRRKSKYWVSHIRRLGPKIIENPQNTILILEYKSMFI